MIQFLLFLLVHAAAFLCAVALMFVLVALALLIALPLCEGGQFLLRHLARRFL